MSSRTEGGLAGNDDELIRLVLVRSSRDDGANPKTFASSLATAASRRVWERLLMPDGKPFPNFKAFLLADREDGGVGLAPGQLEHAAKLAGQETYELVAMVLREEHPIAPERTRGRPEKNSGTIISNPNRDTDYILARLKRDDPTLADRVVRGEITANAAAREKGWRKERILVTSPEHVAVALRRIMPPPDLSRLVELLKEGA